MIFERRVGFCDLRRPGFKTRYGFCFRKNPMKQNKYKNCHDIFKMDLQYGIHEKGKKLMKLNVGPLKSIYLIKWWSGMSKINFPSEPEKIKFKCLFWFPMFRILKNR